jgi:cytochrome c biogenesis protein
MPTAKALKKKARQTASTDRLWQVFTSVRLTIGILVCLTLLSVAGTLIAQQGTTQVPLENLYKLETLKWLVRLGATDIYHSATFVLLLFLLAVNLIACSIERLPRVWRDAFHVAPPPVADPHLESWDPESARARKYLIERPGRGSFKTVGEAKMAAMLFFQRRFGRYVVLRDSEDQFQVMLEQGKYSRLGVYITHLSLLLIMFGAGLGAVVGFEGGINIEEGTRVSWLQHVKGSNGGMKNFVENGQAVPNFLALPFEVECEKFTLETYDGERPKAFRSVLNFYENDVKVHSAEIAVNHPTVYKGMTFYQASYNEAGLGAVALKVFRVSHGRKPSTAQNPAVPSLIKGKMPAIDSVELVDNVHPGDLYRVDGAAAFKVVQVEPNLMDLGPAAKVQFFKDRSVKRPEEFWVFKNLPGFDFAHRKGAALNFVLEAVKPKFATGLSVARDPGVWVVWIGSAILVLALFIALYTCHSRYWVAYTPRAGFVLVGWSNKLFLFEPRYEKFRAAFREEFKI